MAKNRLQLLLLERKYISVWLDLSEFPSVDLDILGNRRRGRSKQFLLEIDLNLRDKENSAPTTSKRVVIHDSASKKI